MESKQQSGAKNHSRNEESSKNVGNFRAHYYEKVGFRGVEERRAFAHILRDKPRDLNKLREFMHRFTVSDNLRLLSWKLILGVIPKDCENETELTIKQEQKQICAMLRESLRSMLYIDNHTPKNTVFVLMFLLEKGKLKYDVKRQMESNELGDLVAIASIFNLTDASFEENYWLFRNFCIHKKDQGEKLLEMAEKFQVNSIEDNELVAHLKNTRANEALPISFWYSRLYSGILHKDSLVKIFDKIIAGCLKILPVTAQTILLTLKPHLMSMTSIGDIRAKLSSPLTLDCSEKIVVQVLDSWSTMKF